MSADNFGQAPIDGAPAGTFSVSITNEWVTFFSERDAVLDRWSRTDPRLPSSFRPAASGGTDEP